MTSQQPPQEQQTPITGAVNALTEATTGAESRVAALVKSKAPPAPVPMRYAVLAVHNRSTVVSDAEARTVCAALQVQITRDFAPVWRVDAAVVYVPGAQTPPADAWTIVIADDSDTPNALGYHEVDAANRPRGFVFARTDAQDGLSWSVTLSHEALETLADPWAMSTLFNQTSNTTGTLIPIEVGDPVESDAMAVVINGVKLSNWVTPEYFNGTLAPNAARFDFGGHLTAPLSLAPGGYSARFQVLTGSGWGQINARGEFVPSSDGDDDNTRHRR